MWNLSRITAVPQRCDINIQIANSKYQKSAILFQESSYRASYLVMGVSCLFAADSLYADCSTVAVYITTAYYQLTES